MGKRYTNTQIIAVYVSVQAGFRRMAKSAQCQYLLKSLVREFTMIVLCAMAGLAARMKSPGSPALNTSAGSSLPPDAVPRYCLGMSRCLSLVHPHKFAL